MNGAPVPLNFSLDIQFLDPGVLFDSGTADRGWKAAPTSKLTSKINIMLYFCMPDNFGGARHKFQILLAGSCPREFAGRCPG